MEMILKNSNFIELTDEELQENEGGIAPVVIAYGARIIGGALITASFSAINSYVNTGTVNLKQVGMAALQGASAGAFAGLLKVKGI